MATTTYDWLLRPTRVVEQVAGSADRVTTTSFEQAGVSPRLASTATTGGLGTELPATVASYDSTSGLPTASAFAGGGGVLRTGFDELGRTVSVTDADGATTTTSYDGAGRVGSVDTGVQQLSYAYAYTGPAAGGGTDRRGLLMSVTASRLGSTPMTAAYDADGQLVSQVLPDGLTATNSFDPTGDATAMEYRRGSVQLIADRQRSSVHGQWAANSSYGVDRSYGYDGAGRLTGVQETLAGRGCAQRGYSFDVNSNRLAKTFSTGASCSSLGGPGTQADSYDGADRLVTTGRHAGMSLDLWGRTTVLPAGSSEMPAGNTSIGYVNTDVVSTMLQDGVTRAYGYDPAGRRRTIATSGSPQGGEIANGTTVNHYDSTGDNPAWTLEPDGSRTIYTDGISGQLAAASTLRADGSVATRWQLTNLHGDIITTMSPGEATPGSAWTTDEYGHPTGNIPDQAAPGGRYGWLGGHQRSRQAAGATILMGARLYSPKLGRFLQRDPVLGGNANTYTYPVDPINNYDLDGRDWKKWARRALVVGAFGSCLVLTAGACFVAGAVAGIATARIDAGCWKCRSFRNKALANVAWAGLGAGAGGVLSRLYKGSGAWQAARHARPRGGFNRWALGPHGRYRPSYYVHNARLSFAITAGAPPWRNGGRR